MNANTFFFFPSVRKYRDASTKNDISSDTKVIYNDEFTESNVINNRYVVYSETLFSPSRQFTTVGRAIFRFSTTSVSTIHELWKPFNVRAHVALG